MTTKQKKVKVYILFSNGIEIKLPKGFHFEGKVTISGIVPDSYSTYSLPTTSPKKKTL